MKEAYKYDKQDWLDIIIHTIRVDTRRLVVPQACIAPMAQFCFDNTGLAAVNRTIDISLALDSRHGVYITNDLIDIATEAYKWYQNHTWKPASDIEVIRTFIDAYANEQSESVPMEAEEPDDDEGEIDITDNIKDIIYAVAMIGMKAKYPKETLIEMFADTVELAYETDK